MRWIDTLRMPDTMRALIPAQPSALRSSAWVRGPVWDGVWMLNALWLAPLVLWLAHGYSDPESSPLDIFYLGLTALFWIGHRLCSTWLAYCTEAYRPLLRNKPVQFVVLPLLVTVACFAVFLPADEAFPWTREERVVGMAILDYGSMIFFRDSWRPLASTKPRMRCSCRLSIARSSRKRSRAPNGC